MRNHYDIIKDAGGPHAVARAVLTKVGEDNLAKLESRVRGWSLQKSIPSEYWPTVVELGFATLEELAAAAEARKFPELATQREAAA